MASLDDFKPGHPGANNGTLIGDLGQIDKGVNGMKSTDSVNQVGEAPATVGRLPVDGPRVGQWTERQAFDYEVYTAPRDPEAPKGEPTGQWAASGPRYEWKEEYGDVAPADEKLERMLFGEPGLEDHSTAGIQFNK